MKPTRTRQLVVASLMAYATILAWYCPCPKVLSCHLPHFFFAVGTASALVLHEN